MDNNLIYKNDDIRLKMHWYTNDQMMLSEHPFYKRSTRDRIKFLNECLDNYIPKISSQGPKGCVVLDAGCGDGVALKMVNSREDCTVFSCDYNLIRARRAQAEFNDKVVINSDLIHSPFKGESFSVVIMNQVLEHIQDDLSALSEARRILRHDGILILGVPNEGCFMGKLRNSYIQPWIKKQTDHRHFYTLEEIIFKISKSGFSVVHLRRDGFIFPYSRLNDLLASFKLGYALVVILGRVFKSQCGGLYLVCQKVRS